ncbi:hypothetical protein FNV43_RR02705 [Rhamnella rubrinervis]|uniref:Uncharacterized protein n=1 Tax=Rhamnella rubrinervis TaxID=2594499 RepID=A0A8K0MN75_9ROSA|nr:hypothetical protein FNV43_RR02705 [Rhamnella rubrinervis]
MGAYPSSWLVGGATSLALALGLGVSVLAASIASSKESLICVGLFSRAVEGSSVGVLITNHFFSHGPYRIRHDFLELDDIRLQVLFRRYGDCIRCFKRCRPSPPLSKAATESLGWAMIVPPGVGSVSPLGPDLPIFRAAFFSFLLLSFSASCSAVGGATFIFPISIIGRKPTRGPAFCAFFWDGQYPIERNDLARVLAYVHSVRHDSRLVLHRVRGFVRLFGSGSTILIAEPADESDGVGLEERPEYSKKGSNRNGAGKDEGVEDAEGFRKGEVKRKEGPVEDCPDYPPGENG